MENRRSLLDYLKELWFLPFIVYIAGFVYVNGYMAPFLTDSFILKNVITILPVSLNLFLFNGIYVFIFILAAPLIISIIMLRIHSAFFDSIIARLRSWGHRVAAILYVILMIGYLLVLALIIPLLQVLLQHVEIKENFIHLLYMMIFSITAALTIFVYRLTLQFFRGPALLATILSSFIIWASVFISLMFLYSYGFHLQFATISSYENQTDDLEFARVFDESGGKKIYIKVDISADFFIGYDLHNKRGVYLPGGQIKKIETFKVKKNIGIRKYNANSTALTDVQHKAAVAINDYYAYVIDNPKNRQPESVQSYMELFSLDYIAAKLGNIAPEILYKKMQAEPYREKAIEQFYGFELSVPAPEQPESKDSDYMIYVKEHWKGETFDLLFTVSKEGLIENIEETVFSF